MATAYRVGGNFLVTMPGAPDIEGETFLCPHCQRIEVIQPGSGKVRGFCMHCMKPTCGRQECLVCDPFQKKHERAQARDKFQRDMATWL